MTTFRDYHEPEEPETPAAEEPEAPVTEEPETQEAEAGTEGDLTESKPRISITADGESITLAEAKEEIKDAVIEPAQKALAGWTEIVADTISGTLSGLLSRKRRVDK